MKDKSIVSVFLVIVMFIGCTVTKNTINPDSKLTGEWSLVTKDTPQGDIPIIMTLTKDEVGQFHGTFDSIMGNLDMLNLILENGQISCNLNVQGTIYSFKGEFLNDKFKGETFGPREVYTTTGNKIVQ